MSVDPQHRHFLEPALVAVLGITIVLFALGSSSVPVLLTFGHRARWLGLVVLVLLALGEAALARPTPPPVTFKAIAGIALALVVLAALSTAWSVAPKLTFERSVSLLILFAAAALVAYAVSATPRIWPWVLGAILAAAVTVCLLGVLLLAFDSNEAMQPAFPGTPARFRGLGQNPNTVPMLAAIAVPIAYWAATELRNRLVRVVSWLSLALLVGTIAASNSRGALVAAVAALVAYAAVSFRVGRALLVCVVVGAVVAAGFGTTRLMPTVTVPVAANAGRQSPTAANAGGQSPTAANGRGKSSTSAKHVLPQPPPSAAGYFPGALYDEIGRPMVDANGVVSRSQLGSSGRLTAWKGALSQGNQRPLLGYGFGTEDRVFADRFYVFEGSRPENSYLGMYLQLGAVGLLLLLAAWLVLARSALALARARSRDGAVAAVCAAIVVAGLCLSVVQSYVYSVGNIASVSFWLAVFLLAVSAPEHRR